MVSCLVICCFCFFKEKAHLLGHVNPEAMRRNIRLKYYWKTLENECKRFATKCGECQRFSKKGTFDHPAKAIEITHIFERIGMDVTEIYKNDEEIHMVLVISEYFTKTVKIYPLKTKTGEEIAGKLWLWIAQFVPGLRVSSLIFALLFWVIFCRSFPSAIFVISFGRSISMSCLSWIVRLYKLSSSLSSQYGL